jgi:hypothetical protein
LWGGEEDAALQFFVRELQREHVALSDEFAEMIDVSSARTLVSSPTLAAAELLAEPMTAAESTGALVMAAIAAHARDEGIDDEAILRVMAKAAVLVARFETYLAERRSVTRCVHDD